MEEKVLFRLNELMERYPALENERDSITNAYEIMKNSYEKGGKLLIGGNGGSAADSGHIVGELMKGFVKKRPVDKDFSEKLKMAGGEDGERLSRTLQMGLPAIAITEHSALSTAFSNDVPEGSVFAQQILGYGKEGDVFLGITTSGNSRNILDGAIISKAMGIKVIGLTGASGGKLKSLADCTITVPENETFKIQEYHLPIYHALCLMLEETFFEK